MTPLIIAVITAPSWAILICLVACVVTMAVS